MKFKTLLICSLIALISSVSYGQNKRTFFVDDEEDDSVTTRYYDLHNGHWAGVDFGLNMMLDKSFGRSFDGKEQFKNNLISSYNFRLNFIDHKLVIIEDRWGVTIGAGYSHSSFDVMKNYTLKESVDSKTKEKVVTESFDSLNYTYNKIRASYLQIPLLLEYTPNKNSWVSLGVIAGYRFGSNIKNLFEYQKVQYITKTKGDFNLNTFQCDASVRFGYKSFGGYATYSLIPLFNSKMIAISPLSFGLSINY
jgi:hypothetical protein